MGLLHERDLAGEEVPEVDEFGVVGDELVGVGLEGQDDVDAEAVRNEVLKHLDPNFIPPDSKDEDEDENDSVVMDMENPIADEIIMDEVARELAELNLFGFKEIIGSRKRKQS